jgi:hypothetical protein
LLPDGGAGEFEGGGGGGKGLPAVEGDQAAKLLEAEFFEILAGFGHGSRFSLCFAREEARKSCLAFPNTALENSAMPNIAFGSSKSKLGAITTSVPHEDNTRSLSIWRGRAAGRFDAGG